jgi:DNA-binding CsgD family transcriptional regulator
MSQGMGSHAERFEPIVREAQGIGDASIGLDEVAKRRLIAEVCKVVGTRVGAVMPDACNDPKLSRRQRQTLQLLLKGDIEKEVAAKLGVSRHTVHVYVKALYKHFGVSSRGELLAKCLSRPIPS